MKILKATLNRKFNLGNYESLDVGVEAELNENDNILDVWSVLKDTAENWHFTETQKKEKVEKAITQPTQLQQKTANPVDVVRSKFPEELVGMLDFKQAHDTIMIKPVGFLGSENFAKISSVVRATGGEYISAGKDSHFRVICKRN